MNETKDLTTGSISGKLLRFAIPYLLAAFLQTFYGLADLFVVGLYYDADTSAAVSIGSQVMHLFTVVVLGLAMGSTVLIGKAVGAKKEKDASVIVGSSICLFSIVAVGLTIFIAAASPLLTFLMSTPSESVGQTNSYIRICSLGVPFIVAYNVISSFFRGAGDSRRPLYFVGIACVVNIALDFLFVGEMRLGSNGAAIATILGQAVSVMVSLVVIRKKTFGFVFHREDIRLETETIGKILNVGAPIALQDGFIQIAFIVITIIANHRGLRDATAVGIVEKIISFLFLVPSSFLSAISAITAHNMGAGKPERARKSLYVGILITALWGALFALLHQFSPEIIVQFFSKNADVVHAGGEYIRSYSVDIFFAAFHFCFSGYFCGIQKSQLSFIHNVLSILLVRVPGSYFFSKWWMHTLYPMGWAAPLGSFLSGVICFIFFLVLQRREHVERNDSERV